MCGTILEGDSNPLKIVYRLSTRKYFKEDHCKRLPADVQILRLTAMRIAKCCAATAQSTRYEKLEACLLFS